MSSGAHSDTSWGAVKKKGWKKDGAMVDEDKEGEN